MATPSTEETSIVDPDGDVILILPNECGLSPNSSQRPAPTRFKASSKHLTLASAFFKAQFSSNWRKGRELGENGTVAVHISTADHDSWTMSILMNMIHGRQRHIPFSAVEGCPGH
ncbi:uncharacterized protein N7458_004007 [Penicillium daleae]|uniref:BTB domain-containing protein n=1 Tax=Penicillium daleae TaxID=63821 RepID=A0AAD6C9M0_9EURO|nr:uncharacterized protein N7458_004007 [Penicillium daleae]KAJ5455743.1 hypothetical protein N7458_004007 [Penicillium daleae]